MQETITSLTETLKSLPAWMKLTAIIAILCAGLAYTIITNPEEIAPEPTVTKQVEVGQIEGGVQGGFNISQ